MESYIIQLIIATGASFLFLVAVFVPLEKAFPAMPNQKSLRPRWGTDLLFFLGQYFIWSGLMVWLLIGLTNLTDQVVPSGFRAAVASQPWWLQAIEAILLSDLCVYWGHRFQHRSNFLWRFHSVHHSAEHLDWLAAHREHPLDTVYTQTILNLPPLVLGFPLSTIAALITFRGLWAIYIHSNVRIPLGPFKCLVGAPQLHHWHHDRDRALGNYANLSPIMDLFFGTYVCPDHEPSQVGLADESAKSYWSYLIDPLTRSKLR
jgi:sterol desaturase/sphingolipid hydroxylase (fatty acid hydroxylase superfamily)